MTEKKPPSDATWAKEPVMPMPSVDELLATMRKLAAKYPPPVVLTRAPPSLHEMTLGLAHDRRDPDDGLMRLAWPKLSVTTPPGLGISFLSLIDEPAPELRDPPEFPPDLDVPFDAPPEGFR